MDAEARIGEVLHYGIAPGAIAEAEAVNDEQTSVSHNACPRTNGDPRRERLTVKDRRPSFI